MKNRKLKTIGMAFFILILLLFVECLTIKPKTTQAAKKTKVTIDKKKTSLYVGQTLQLRVIGAKKVKWKTSKKKVATVSSKGLVRAKKKGKATITGTVNRQNYKCIITVKKYPKTNDNDTYVPNITVTSVSLDYFSMFLETGQSKSLTATLFPSNSKETVVWSSENPAIASVNQNGMVTGVGAGTTNIYVKVGNYTSFCIVEVIKDYNTAIKPSYEFSMSNETVTDCSIFYISVTNKGTSTMRILPDVCSLFYQDAAGNMTNQIALKLIDQNVFKNENRIVYPEYIDIPPGNEALFAFEVVGSPTLYDSQTLLGFSFMYDSRYYAHAGSYAAGFGAYSDIYLRQLTNNSPIIVVPLK